MERRQDSPVPAVLSAGTDPAHIPGLDEPVVDAPVEPDGHDARETIEEEDAAPGAAAEAVVEDGDGADGGDGPEDARPDGPAFEVSDRRGAIVADGSGVVFRLDDTEARLEWSEIGAVELGTPRLGRRFSVTVYTTDRRCYEADVEAPARRDLRTWTAEFDAVLDAWFEDGTGREEDGAGSGEEGEDRE
jgi:hypothetical protein